MNVLQALILGLVQGFTEFIPVSSSGHLVLAHSILGVDNNGLAFDVALHFGTLIALLIYFRKDLWELGRAVFVKSEKTKLAYLLALSTIPAIVSGFLLEKKVESAFRSVGLVAVNFIVVSVIMLFAEWWYKNRVPKKTELKNVGINQTVTIGLAQALAVIPGVSRSGSTILTGLFVGLDRLSAARFSFLLGVPIMLGATTAVLTKAETAQAIANEQMVFVVGILAAFVSGMAAIVFMLRFLAKHTLKVFAYYRLAVGILVLVFFTVR